MNHPHHPQLLQLTRNFLTDGYISYTFSPQMAEFFIVELLFKVGNSAAIEAIRDPGGSGAYFVFNNPSHFSPPPHAIHGRGAWVLDYNVRSGGSVVRQELWVPQGQGDRRRYVDQARFRMPVFFVGMNGSLGVPVLNAAAGDMQLHDVHLPPPLQDKTTTKIRIAVCALFFSVLRVPPSLTTLCYSGQAMLLPNLKFSLGIKLLQRTPLPLIGLSSMWEVACDSFWRCVRLGSCGDEPRKLSSLQECERVPVQQPFKWMLGNGNISSDEVMLIGIVQVSEGSWMPILQLMRRVVI